MTTPLFIVKTEVERTLPECFDARDEAAYLSLSLALSSRNFHFFEIRFSDHSIRVEAIRSQPDPDIDHDWQWPEAYRLMITRGMQTQEESIDRADILSLEILGMQLGTFDLRRVLRRKRLKWIAYRFGRFTKTCMPKFEITDRVRLPSDPHLKETDL